MMYLIMSSKVFAFSIWTQQFFACSKSTIRTKCETCSYLAIKTPERHHSRRSTVFIWTVFAPFSCVLFGNFEQVIFCQKRLYHSTHNLWKQDLFFHLILQLLKFVLRYVKQKIEQEWVAYLSQQTFVLMKTSWRYTISKLYSLNYPLVTL